MEKSRKGITGIKRRWVRNYLVTILAITIVFNLLFMVIVRNFYYNYVNHSLENRLSVSAGFYNKYLKTDNYSFDEIAQLIIKDSEDSQMVELQIIDKTGLIQYSSSGFNTETKINAQDVQVSLQGATGHWYGKDDGTGEKIMSASIPLINSSGNTIGVMRYISSLTKADAMVYRMGIYSVFIVLSIFVVLLVMSLTFSASILRPINDIISMAKQMADGNLNERISNDYKDELGILADTLNDMADQIQKTERLKNDFISSISHEIRTPLTAITGWGETILTGGFDDMAQVDKGLAVILKETTRLSGMVNELLDFSRMESGRFTLYLENFMIDEEVSSTLQMFRPRAEKLGIKLVQKFEFEGISLEGDSNRLRQVFINLLDNAIKFSADGQSIYVDIIQEEEFIKILIQDEGVGILEEDLPLIKNKFYKGQSKKSGSGIGLAICDEIVEQHGGKLELKSEYGKGTTASILLRK
jgi:signal transduction histidine kinase